MIDPLETVLLYLKADPALEALVGTRIASRHQYGDRWVPWEAAVTVRLDGGQPDIYVSVQPVRFEVRVYGPSQYEVLAVWRRLVELSRETNRRPVLTSTGSALLYWLAPASGPSMLYDTEIKADFLLQFYDAMVHEQEAG